MKKHTDIMTLNIIDFCVNSRRNQRQRLAGSRHSGMDHGPTAGEH